MPRKTKFSELWLKNTLDDGKLISCWCEASKEDPYTAYCKLCNKHFSVSNMGFSQLVSHSKSQKHQIKMKCAENQSTFSIVTWDGGGNSTLTDDQRVSSLQLVNKNRKVWIPSNINEKTLKAEALILLTAVKCNYSFASINDLVKIIPLAFEDSDIAKNIKLSDTKARYMVKFGLAPYFRQKIFLDLFESSSYYTLYFDETITKQVKKQMDIYIAYWSEKHEKIVAFYCDSFFLGHADAQTIFDKIIKFISENGLQLSRLLQCSMDGPNINLSFQRKINSHLATQNLENLIDIGTCSLHVMHNAFKKGITELDCDVEKLVSNIFQWFKLSAARREDYYNVQVSVLVESAANHLFQRHVENRWSTLGPVCERIIEQYEALKEYFLKFLPKSNIKTGDKYNNISAFLKDSKTLMYLHFVVFLSDCFKPYLKLFQKEDLLIHILFKKQNELLRSIMFKFLKDDIVGQKEGLSLSNVNCQDPDNWLTLKKIDVGSAAQKMCNPENKNFLHCIRNAYIKITEYLQKKLPLSSPLLRDLQYISPDCVNNQKSKEAISRIADHMIKVTKTDRFCDNVKSEYSVYMHDNLSKEKELYSKENNICQYWAEIAKKKDAAGTQKYPNLTKLVKSALTLSHGNSIPERGFSQNNNIVTHERSALSEVGIKSIRVCKDYLKNQESVSSIMITKELIHHMQKARSEYASYLDQIKAEEQKEFLKRKREEEEENEILKKKLKKDLKETLNSLSVKENDLLKEQEASHMLLNDANQKLQAAVKNNDFNCMKVAQMMLDTANNNLKNVGEKLTIVRQDIFVTQRKNN